ncbi:glycerophosphodiester phosphodiesterase [Georgenia sp. Marseille-Q6866]
MRVVAHRGNSSAAPENTLAAIASAVACGANGVEIDVRLTGDRVPVVIHDETLDRTTDGSGPVAATPAAEVTALDAGAWFGQRFVDERVPLLTDVLDLLVAAGDVELFLEVKGTWDADDVRRVTDAVASRGLGDRVLAQSFSAATVAALATVAPKLRRGLLVKEAGDGVLELCRRLETSACNPHGALLRTRPEVTGRAQAAGLTVTPWTLNEPEDWAAARELGVDGIITDRPADLLAWAAVPAA